MNTLFKMTGVMILLMLSFLVASCTQSDTANEEFTINRGTNISHWLSQSKVRGEDRRAFFTEKDVSFIAGQGYDHIRLPVDEVQLWDEQGNKEEEAFDLLHNSLRWADNAGLRVIIDLHIVRSHHFNNKVRPLWTVPEEQEKFIHLWEDLSEELNVYPDHFLAYEIMNEAVTDDPENWNMLISRTMKRLRELEPERKIVIGSNMWQSVHTFKDLKIPDGDQNIILSFHFYNPFPFTHHTASWTGIADYTGPVKYPGQLFEPSDLEGLPENLYNQLSGNNREYNIDVLEEMMSEPLAYAHDHQLPLYCGEFGCLPTVPREMRMQWYTDMRTILERNNIAWAHWDYKGGFGIIKRETGEPDAEFIEVLVGE